MPWELMIPSQAGRGNRKPLGVEFCVARWTDRTNVAAAPQKVHLIDSSVVAPQYDDKAKVLKWAEKEKDLVLATFTGKAIMPASFPEVEKELETQLRSLVHFVCHGQEESGIQTIDLEDGKMSCNALLGMDGVAAAFAKKHPLVFLNACEVGRRTPALFGLGGFADSFIQIGASAVIAPLWSVEDEAAHDVASEFYRRVKKEPNTPFAEILRGIRAKAYETGAKDTYAAYCFYGDPAAIRVS
jgi:CHAT domain-containing protein